MRIADLAARNGGDREVAASFLLSWYAASVVGPVGGHAAAVVLPGVPGVGRVLHHLPVHLGCSPVITGMAISVGVVEDEGLVEGVRAALAAAADPTKAGPMQAYMKTTTPFLGVPKPARDRALRPVWKAHPLTDPHTWLATVQTLWRTATYREERYAAVELATRRRPADGPTTETLLALYEEMIVAGAWWDLVDEIANRGVGPLLRADPETVAPTMRRWAKDPDRWERRTAVICQVTAKGATDRGLLYECVEPNLADPDFFLREGIGWALRSYAWIEPDEVRRYVAEHADRLSPLSRREALKNVGA